MISKTPISLKKPRRRARRLACALLAACCAATAQAAMVTDWLAFSAGADNRHFSLKNDLGVTVAQAELQITLGIPAPLSPSAGLLQDSFWITPPDFTDSVLGDATLATSKVQVAPQAGVVQFRLAMTGTDLSGLYFAVGQLFSNGTNGTMQINISATTAASAPVAVNFLGTNDWDNGIRLYDQPLNWDGILGKLSLSPGANGESQFAFFRVGTGASAVTSLNFDIPSGYNLGVGDALEFALGAPVPEPTSAALCLMCGAICLFARPSRPLWRRSPK